MTETIEEEALRRVNDSRAKTMDPPVTSVMDSDWSDVFFALEQLITEHRATKAELEAFKRGVSEAVSKTDAILDRGGFPKTSCARDYIRRFIIAKPDPLAEAFSDIGTIDPYGAAKDFRAALAARGLKIVEDK